MIVYALKRFIFLTGLIISVILMQNEIDKPTRLLRFVALVHLPFSFRSLDLFIASLLFMKGTSYCVVTVGENRAVRSCYGKF